MKVDVVVVTYRSADRIAACLDSVGNDADTSIVVVDNDSHDAGPSIARARGVVVVENDQNLGFAAAANQGARSGTAEAILFLNPDARLRPGAHERLVARLSDPEVGVVGANLVDPDGSPQRSRWPYPSASTMWSEALGLGRRHRSAGSGGEFVVGACLLVRRAVFEQVGGFDERYWLYGEEADLCRRIERAGGRIVTADDAVVEHEGGASGRDAADVVADHFMRGSDRFVLDHEGRVALFSYRLAGLTAAALRYPLLRRSTRGRDRATVRAAQVRRTVRALVRHPISVPGPALSGEPTQIVLLSLEPWDDVWRRNQFLVRELLRLHPDLRVLWVEPASDPLHEMLRTRWIPRIGGRSVRRVPTEPRVLLFRPHKLLPRSVWPRVDQSLSNQVRRVAARAGFRRPIVWVNDSTYLPLVRSSTWRVVYDITDDWIDASGPPRRRRRLEQRERDLIACADEVVVCSPELEQRRSSMRPVHLVPNAVDADHMTSPQERPIDLPPGPNVLYVGSLHDDRLDVELLTEMAAALPQVGIVLVGPNSLSRTSIGALDRFPNVHRLGPRPYARIPAYLQHADVIVVPHRVSAFTDSLDPIKAYECLASGRPTLATPVAGFRELAGAVAIADRAEFTARLAEILEDPERHAPGRTVVPTWRERAVQFGRILQGRVPALGPARRFRVVYVGHTAVASGGELALARLLPGLRHVDAHVILGEDGPISGRLRAAGATVEVMPIADDARAVKRDAVVPGRLPLRALGATARATTSLAARLRELDPDVVHTNTLKAAIYGGVAARLARAPVVWHIRDRIAPDYLPRFAVVAIRALAHVVPDGIITNSTATQRTLGATTRVMAVTPSPVVHDPVDDIATTEATGDGFVVGMVGRLAPWKGQDVFLRAFARAFPDGPERALVVGGALFGEDDFAASLSTLVDRLGVTDRVELTGHVENVADQLGRMHAVVHASVIPEPFGQVVIEAMAAGRPVIASAAGGPAEIIRDGIDGLLVPPGDVAALAAAMRRLADDPDLRADLASAARQAVARYSPERIGAEVERVYARVARARPS